MAFVGKSLREGVDPADLLGEAKEAMNIVGQRFARDEYFIPDLVFSGEILKSIVNILKPYFKKDGESEHRGKVIIATVAGDIHNIGKDLVVFMLDVNGFDVTDLGIDVPAEKFIDAIKKTGSTVVGLSGFLTLAFDSMKETIKAIDKAGLRDKVKIMIGGGQIDEQVRDFTGADGYGRDAMAAVQLAKAMEKKWEEMSADEKQEAQFQKLLVPKDPEGNDLQFQSSEARATYTASINRLKDAIQLKRLPDRVPVTVFPNMLPHTYAGITPQEAMYDYEKCITAYEKFVLDFQLDFPMGAAGPGPGKFYEILDYRLYSWPGHGVTPEHSYQCNEREYMKAEEYDLLIADPSFYFRNFYLPPVFGKLEPWTMLAQLTGILEMYGVAYSFIPFGLPPVQEAYKALFEAGAEALKWAMAVGGIDIELATLGFPNIFGGFSKAPFDVLDDTLRGTKGVMLDMYRQPDKLLKALETITPLMSGLGLGAAQQTGKPFIFMPLHKGTDGFLSDEQFKTFYWPSLKQVIMGLIDGGCIPLLAAEGSYNTRLKYLTELPKGKTLWMFDQTDMAVAKEVVGDTLCLLGNVPSSLLKLGTPQEVRDYAKKLIGAAGKGGGFIMCNGAFFDEAVPENVKAMVDFTKEYGV